MRPSVRIQWAISEQPRRENDIAIWLASGTINAAVSSNTVSTLGYTGTSAFAPIGIMSQVESPRRNNSVTQNSVSNITSNGTTLVAGIQVAGATDGVTINGNNVSGVQNTSTSTYGAFGLLLNGGNNHVVRNNFISNVNHNMQGGAAFSTTFGVFGISIQTGTGHKVYDNSVNLFGLMPGTAATSLLSAAFALVSTFQPDAMCAITSLPITLPVELRRLHTCRPIFLRVERRR